jgi:predicted ATPase/DNA-binding SARP family transcriptional activator/Tfp pilus assembly protein PilF
MDAPWHIELLGRLRATQGGHVVTRFRARRTGSLLAYLAFYLDRPHPREVLIELLWPEAETHSGRSNLSRELTSLRRQLEPPGMPAGAVVLADRDSVQLNPAACATDVKAFEAALQMAACARGGAERVLRLTEAVDLYGGELLPGYFEDWILPERQRLAERFLHALAQLTASLERAHDYPGAIQWARRAVAADPLREEGHHALIRLLQAAGQPAAALRQYEELERLLSQELGAAPAPETRNLVQEIRSQGPGIKGQSTPAAPAVSPAPPIAPSSTAQFAGTGAKHRSGPRSPFHPPTGTVTLLFAEIDENALEGCQELLRPLFLAHGGYELQAASGMFRAAFARASDALAAAVAAQQAVESRRPGQAATVAPSSIRTPEEDPALAPSSGSLAPASGAILRMALHTAEVPPDKQAQHSPALQHATRLLLAAHPGQILLSEKSAVLLRDDLDPDVHLLDLGRYRLRAEAPPEQLFQACFPDMPAGHFPPPDALPAHEGSLPLQFTRFFGREEEIARLCRLLNREGQDRQDEEFVRPPSHPVHPVPPCSMTSVPRLVTLTGPGGSGKTRLALEVAGQLRMAFHGAVWFVPLQDLADARLIPDKLLDVLRLPRSPQLQPLEQAVAFLSRQPSLLLLDNFEHLVTDGALLVQTLLEQVPTLTCLVTSRQRLNLAGEQEFPVAPLPVPGVQGFRRSGVQDEGVQSLNAQTPERLDALSQCASVRLFVDRAQAVQPHFQITARNAGAVAALCRRLDGLPLALELAATRVGVLTPAQMLERLSQRFEVLASTQRGVSPRHRSLWAALEWSYQLLAPALQRFFARLSVFQGGWTLEAAEAVCEEPQALQYLEQLRECTLVQAEETGGGTAERSEVVMRFRLLETLREFGAEHLGPEERAALAHRHASYYLALAERAEPELVRSGQMAWLDRLERDLDNLRAALAWLGASGRIQEALRLGGALRRFWYARGGLVEGLERLKWLLALPGAEARTSARAKALNAAGLIAGILGDRMAARSLSEESLAIGRELGDRWNMALALTGLGYTVSSEGNLEAARSLLEEALTIWREVGDLWGFDRALHALGWVAYSRRDYGAARALYQECLRFRSERGDRWGIANMLGLLGSLAREQGEYEEARRCAEQSLSVAREFGDRHSIFGSLEALGHIAYLKGDLSAARALLEQSLALAREIGNKETTGWNLAWLAGVSADAGDPDAASAYLEEAISIGWKPGDPSSSAWSLLQQGRIAQQRGDPLAARRCFLESLARAQAVGSQREIVNNLEGLAAVAADEGQPERACRLFAAAAVLREADGRPLAPIDQRRYETHRAAVHAALGEEGFTAAWAAGRAMTPDEAVSVAVA